MSSTTFIENKILARFQEFLENDLTKEVIIPLFRRMGFENVEFFGGMDEKGKDIIFWKTDEFLRRRLKVVQVKHFKLARNLSSSKSFINVVNQLIACFENSVRGMDGENHLPNEAFLITTYKIDAKVLAMAFDTNTILKTKNITIIDGIELAKLLIRYFPEMSRKLYGLETDIQITLQTSLSNEKLLSILGYNGRKEISTFYTDIGFSPGKQSTKLFFNENFQPIEKSVLILEESWSHFKNVCNDIRKEFKMNFLTVSFDHIERRFASQKVLYEEYKKSGLRIKSSKDKIDLINSQHEEIKDQREKIKNNQYRLKKIEEIDRQIAKIEIEREQLVDEATRIGLDLKLPLHYVIYINGEKIVEQIISKRKWIECEIRKLNDRRTASQLQSFIERGNTIIESTNKFFCNLSYFDCIGLPSEVVHDDFSLPRIEVGVQEVLETGQNLLILGEAGAGKTTALQMFAIENINNAERLVIYLPCSQLINASINTNESTVGTREITELHYYISNFLLSKQIAMSSEELLNIIQHKKVTLLLDGLDEAIKSASWFPGAIDSFAKKYERTVQVVVSSRHTGPFIEEIEFLPITLLPFTELQRNIFFSKWFESSNQPLSIDGTTVTRIQSHLRDNPEIDKIVSNPLLATLMCVLAEKNIDLPKTEIRLYTDRLSLLTGFYDRAKGIVNRHQFIPQTLEFFAQKIAFYLHWKGKRAADPMLLQQEVISFSKHIFSTDEALAAFNELVNPCNLLMPMDSSGHLGFGHLRYQEHLVAREILANRTIEIYEFLDQPWWNDVMVMIARMSKDLFWFFDKLPKEVVNSRVNILIKKMISIRPGSEQRELMKMYKDPTIIDGSGAKNGEWIFGTDS